MVVGWVSLLTLFRLNGKARKLGKGYSSMVEQELSLAQRRLWIPPSVQPSSELSKIERLQGSFDEIQEDGATEPDSVSTQNGSNRSHEHAISGHGISRPSTSAYAGSILAILTSERWNLKQVSICISLMKRDVKHFLICFSAICVSLFEHSLFQYTVHSYVGYFYTHFYIFISIHIKTHTQTCMWWFE